MTMPRSLQARLGLSIGLILALLWIATVSVTAVILRSEMDEVFDAALQETAQRLLPLAVVEIISREDDGITQRVGAIRDHEEFFTYVVRDATGRVLLQSHAADLTAFPDWDGIGFRQTETHRLFNESALQGSVRITVAEPLDHRASVARELQMGLGLPILALVPLAVLAVGLAVRASLGSLRLFRAHLEGREARDLSPVPSDGIPSEILPVARTLNDFLDRLKAAFDAERSFAASAAHELRTPLAGAIAQAQRLGAETQDAQAQARAGEIVVTLKRLTRLSERLMQLARAEGARLRKDEPSDLRIAARIIIDELSRTTEAGRIVTHLSESPVLSDLDPDVFGILCRNLVENALVHGADEGQVEVSLLPNGEFSVVNDGAVVPNDTLERLTTRFERAGAGGIGSGLGLAIVASIADRIGSPLVMTSPATGRDAGFEVRLALPVVKPLNHAS